LREALVNLGVLLLLHIRFERLDITVGRHGNPYAALAEDRRRLNQRLHLHNALVGVTARDPLADLNRRA
jgi:hypothetical protein